MRLISQDGNIDVPYERAALVSTLKFRGGAPRCWEVRAVVDGASYLMARYGYRGDVNMADDKMTEALLCYDKGEEKFYQFGRDTP